MKLNVRAFALTTGLIWGLGLFFLTIWIILFEGETGEVTLIGKIYRGYNLTYGGSFIGLIWGFIDGLIGGAIFAWLYNFIIGRSKSQKDSDRII